MYLLGVINTPYSSRPFNFRQRRRVFLWNSTALSRSLFLFSLTHITTAPIRWSKRNPVFGRTVHIARHCFSLQLHNIVYALHPRVLNSIRYRPAKQIETAEPTSFQECRRLIRGVSYSPERRFRFIILCILSLVVGSESSHPAHAI